MTLESFFTKLNQNLERARENLRTQLSKKVNYLVEHLEEYTSTEIRGELDRLVDDFLNQFTSIYQEFISYIEDEIPNIPKPQKKTKPKSKKNKKDTKKNEFVRPTYVHRAFNEAGLRVAKEARPLLMELLNKKIEEDIEKIKRQLPTFQKGEKKGERKRITIKPEDLASENLLKELSAKFEKELDTIPLDVNGGEFKLSILLRYLNH